MYLFKYLLERMSRIELPYPAWEAGVITVIRHTHNVKKQPTDSSNGMCSRYCFIFFVGVMVRFELTIYIMLLLRGKQRDVATFTFKLAMNGYELLKLLPS